jgi:thiamine-monophosphate kinase
MSEERKLTPISDLGEFGLIDHLSKDIKINNESTILGIGDDAAQINHKGKETLLSTDVLVEGIHFDLSYTPLKHLGYKAAVVNISDIVAMNAKPTQILVSIAVSARTSVESLEALYEGLREACKIYNVDLVGGDTTSSRSGLIISITSVGTAKKEDICYRNGAQNNDLICVTGNLGAAYMGLQLLIREKEVFVTNPNSQPDLSKYQYLVQRQLKPETPIKMHGLFKKMKLKPTAMIDISDGLSSEILHICKASKVGCAIYEDQLPIEQEVYDFGHEIQIDPSIAALNGGEDYELLFTVPLSAYDTIKQYPEISIIGHILEEAKGCSLIAKDGTSLPIEAQGFNHYNSN